ncbi:MAG: IS481 family transposase, partial [Candidatus Limnocylindria bacterium]
MDVGRYLVEAHLREGRAIAELARLHGVHRSWLYKLLRRYRSEGERGLVPRSRRPQRSPTAMPADLAEEIVRIRSSLLAEGLDAGALTIQWHLARRHAQVPSASSIIRLLRRRGLVIPEPRKRPRSSFIRFEAALPNELWQTDATHWRLADGSAVEILNVLDDHSRLLVAATAFRTVKATDAVAVFHQAAARVGYPAALLSDNAAVFSGSSRQGQVALESELERLGIRSSHARPYHPQTCGKVERFHQTQKRWLRAQPPAATLEELGSQLARQRLHYNLHRPHRAIGRRRPAEVFDAKVKAGPGSAPAPAH